MWNKTALTERLGLSLPIIQAPMAGGLTSPELVAEVCNAGGLGSVGAGYMSPNEIEQTIKKIRQLTSKPFAVNLFIDQPHFATAEQLGMTAKVIREACHELPGIEIDTSIKTYAYDFEEQIQVIFDEKVSVFSFAFGLLSSKWISLFKNSDTLLIGTATTLKEANKLEESGIDMIVAQGSEAGGHRGTFLGKVEDGLIPLDSLISQCVKQINIPVIAAGGVMTGTRIREVLSLGAVAAQMGTAFLTCPESSAHPEYKKVLLSQKRDNTVLTRAFSGKLARGIENTFTQRMKKSKQYILDYPIQNTLTSSMRKKAKELGNVEFMSLWAGQSANLCRDVTVKELVKRLVGEAES